MNRITRWVMERWRAKQRAIDMDILWPECLAGAHDLEHAKMAFALHCYNDPAWQTLGTDKIREFIRNLEAYD